MRVSEQFRLTISIFSLTLGLTCAATPIQKSSTQGAISTVTDRVAPAGRSIYELVDGETIDVTTKGGYTYGYVTQKLEPTGRKLGQVKYKVSLPKGKSLADVKTAVLSIPPGGSAPVLAPQFCAEKGLASISLQSTTGGRDDALLASQALAVTEALLAENPELKFVFAGFSMGGFGAQKTAWHLMDRCVGLLLIGNYYLGPPFPQNRPVIMLVGADDNHLSYAEKSLKENGELNTDVRLIQMPGAHGWGRAADQQKALELIFAGREV